jgi:hypothetical protein
MADQAQTPVSPSNGGMFSEPPKERSFPTTAVAIAAVAVVILVAVLVLMGHRNAGPSLNTPQPAAAYAPSLALTNIKMSESTSISGGKSTYIDGHITNHGASTVNAITVQVLFANDQAMPPQVMAEPLTLIRTREPYVDTEPVSAAPLAPNGEADFRLTLEGINDNWNGQQPEIRVVRVGTR